MTDRSRAHSDTAGFTFLEVTIALAILGGALVVILGLQSALVERTVVERQQREAMVFAREIFSAVEARESSGDPLDTGSYEGTPQDILGGLLPGSEVEEDRSLQPIAEYRTQLFVEYWGIPSVDERAMKRVELLITWGERQPESLQLVLFIPFDEDELSNQNEEDDADE
ncbi:type II secretion system GspH family protein [bacterium]|nr:type II secretion system GspH family protein [bacterium]